MEGKSGEPSSTRCSPRAVIAYAQAHRVKRQALVKIKQRQMSSFRKQGDLWKASRQKMGTYFPLRESMSPHHTLLNCRGVPARPLTTAVRREVRASNRSGRSSVRSGTWMVKTSRVGLIRREARVLLSFGLLLVAAWRDAKANLQRL